jgi:hypothetical protein
MNAIDVRSVEKDQLPDPAAYRQSEMEPGRDAWDLVRQVWMTKGPGWITLPVDPIAISRRLGIEVLSDDELPTEVTGVLRKEPGFRDAVILLNPLDARERKRFTCAHAIGHYTRNAEMRRDGAWEFVEGRDFFEVTLGDAEEVYATEFAAELLMPRAALRELDEDLSIAALAGIFGVPADVMGFRLDRIGRVAR